MSLRRTQHCYSCPNDIRKNVVFRCGSDSRFGTIYWFYRMIMLRNTAFVLITHTKMALQKCINCTNKICRTTDLNAGAGNACASHNKLISASFATSKELLFAIFENFGDTRPAGSNAKTKLVIFLKISYRCIYRTRHRHSQTPFFLRNLHITKKV